MMRYSREALKTLAHDMLTAGGLPAAMSEVVSELLIQTDEIGVTTHGLSMVPYYLPEIANGNMATEGAPEVIRDKGVSMVWDGNYLPGHWLMTKALDTCLARAGEYGMSALAIRRSHHIGCLAVLVRRAAEQGFVCYLSTSDPSGRRVAPYGGTQPLLTPNPWAIGYPASGHPVLIDSCASITTTSKVREHINAGTQFQHPWILDAQGNATTDARVTVADPPGSILPAGGMDHGHKGFGLGLMIEMQTQALSGHGRAQSPDRWGGNVYLQVTDPEAFGGADAFLAEVDHMNDACRTNRPIDPARPVRVPGDRAHAARIAAQTRGIALPDEVWTRVTQAAAQLGVSLPQPLTD